MEGLVTSCLKKNFDGPTDTPAVHREWWEMCCSNSKFVALSAPRGHAKSTAITHAYLLTCVLFRERSYALIVSDTFSQSTQFLNDVKRELLDNEDLQELFGIQEFLKDSEDDIIVQFTDGAKFRIQAKGAEQKLRGLKWDNKRPDLIVCDDLEGDEQVQNKDRRVKLKRWFYAALVPCISKHGIIRMVGTILHLDSLLESLMPENMLISPSSNRVKLLIKEPLREYTLAKTVWTSRKYRAHNEDYTALLWPEMWPKERLIAYKEDYVRQGLPDVYSQEMLNVPLDEARSFFKRSDFHPMTDIDKKKKINYYIAADLAISLKDKADYTVFIIGGMDEDGIMHIKNVIRDRLDGLEIVNTIITLQDLYDPHCFALEEGQISKSLLPYLNEAIIRRGVFPNLRLVKPLKDKITRAGSIQARMRAGAVKFDKSGEWYQTFEDELLRFPRDKHDDQVDAFSWLGQIVDKMHDASTAEEEAEEEYQEDKRSSGSEEGRNRVTGY